MTEAIGATVFPLTVAAWAAFADPAVALDSDNFMWLWRGVLTVSLLLNVFFLRGIYNKVKKIGPHARALNTLALAVEYLAREAVENGEKRQSDTLILNMLDDVKKLTKSLGEE